MVSGKNRLSSRLTRKLGSNPNNRKNLFNKKLMYLTKSAKQQDLLNYLIGLFNTYVNNDKVSYLSNDDFKTGTYRITKPGLYKLKENIVFHPNPDNDFMPTYQQIKSGKYPVGKDGAYHLGFFAAITIECDNVILDLNQFKIKQSGLHYLMQRFYANIELANSPFIANQGPHTFIKNGLFKSANNSLIMNGNLGLSSHHGIHGNGNNNMVIYDLKINEFEVGAIAMNGAENSIISHVDLVGKKSPVPILGFFSQAIFINRFLKQNKINENKIQERIQEDINQAVDDILNGRKVSNYFHNKSGLPDGNMYGIVLNINGVVVNGLIKKRTSEMIGNRENLLYKINIDNIISHPREIIAMKSREKTENYSDKVLVGPFGDVFPIEEISILKDEKRVYKGTNLSDAQIIISALPQGYNKGTANIFPSIIEWSKNGSDLIKLMDDNNYQFLSDGDDMAHVMKGNIGLFLSCAKNIVIKELSIKNIKIKGNNIGHSALNPEKTEKLVDGRNATGLLETGCENCQIKNVIYRNVSSEYGQEKGNNRL